MSKQIFHFILFQLKLHFKTPLSALFHLVCSVCSKLCHAERRLLFVLVDIVFSSVFEVKSTISEAKAKTESWVSEAKAKTEAGGKAGAGPEAPSTGFHALHCKVPPRDILDFDKY